MRSVTSTARGRPPFDQDIDQGDLARCLGPRERGVEIGDVGDEFAVAAEGGDCEIVACVRQLASDQSIGTILAKLDLMLGVPAHVVADDGNESGAFAGRGLEFGKMEAESSIAHERVDHCLRASELGGEPVAG